MKENAEIRPAAAFARLALWSAATVAAALAVGYLPTHSLAGTAGVTSMLWGLGIALLAALAGLVPPVLALRHGPQQHLKGMLAGAAVRFGVMLALLLSSLLAGPASKVALAIWAAIGYILLLTTDTVGVVWLAKRATRAQS